MAANIGKVKWREWKKFKNAYRLPTFPEKE